MDHGRCTLYGLCVGLNELESRIHRRVSQSIETPAYRLFLLDGLPLIVSISTFSSLATSVCQYNTPSAALLLLSRFISSSLPPAPMTTSGTLLPLGNVTLKAFLARSIRPRIPLGEDEVGSEVFIGTQGAGACVSDVRRTSSRAFSNAAMACGRVPGTRPSSWTALWAMVKGPDSVDGDREERVRTRGAAVWDGVEGREAELYDEWESGVRLEELARERQVVRRKEQDGRPPCDVQPSKVQGIKRRVTHQKARPCPRRTRILLHLSDLPERECCRATSQGTSRVGRKERK